MEQCRTPPEALAQLGDQLMPLGHEEKECGVSETSMCRICHEGDLHEELLSPCQCLGSLATVHRSCLEHWLSSSGTSLCELCQHQFTVKKRQRPLLEWLQSANAGQEKHTLFGDILCFLVITPLATVTSWLCLRGAIDHYYFSSWLESVGLILLTIALFAIYIFWNLVSVRHHYRLYKEWQQSNPMVVVLLPSDHRRASEPQARQVCPARKQPSKESIV
ncbi:E3 ubiquitin-protein ligase MARCHF3-like [Synchiropus splendidus]|uniref:E3 ubiquitin-protein ligase MARCHF3-like n=1 Tax=Synchiropus splendidus TaxID=270530 RepID=UPI00237DC241|nr:E3 ubiquitin-protein ligase MARCHF3-like [Synchiropus splendidus]XP_053737509.1 E3 ubiquitin-protein ligase MARCHF3-like [Synchiropus splendidus]XP_053737515.1 E3 ubiquitin-protein ligase MARCHF3-like [Synchiropus splendidus]XP_053737523.1 E3 ubiquitin-protein ligase MARCHF3-like [Synchiropus splendidus]XP_053737531.1 E3 ubiquitin-protein ligase MARCHF3-like [Synchiropus splendidus]XP_053737538.1 E3 ubiquitin-protein ligase MARCHF3-like [Synchiropus splendidus]